MNNALPPWDNADRPRPWDGGDECDGSDLMKMKGNENDKTKYFYRLVMVWHELVYLLSLAAPLRIRERCLEKHSRRVFLKVICLMVSLFLLLFWWKMLPKRFSS